MIRFFWATEPFVQNPLFRYHSFRLFWLFRVTATLAFQMIMVAVGWHMYDITGSAYDLGLVGLCQFLPSLALTLVVGQAADRYDRRLILRCCLAALTLVALGLAVGARVSALSRESILLASLLIGVIRAFQSPCMAALAPSLVPRDVLAQALATLSAGGQAASIVGPALGGFIYIAGADVVYVASSVMTFTSVCLMARITPLHPIERQKETVSWRTLLAGLSFIWNRKAVLGAISLDLFAVLLGGATALLPIFAKDILHSGPWGQGLLRSAPAVGALLMSLYLAHTPIRRRAGLTMFGGVALYGAVTVVFGLSTSFMLSLLALLLAGAGDMVSVVIRQSLVQLDTPEEMRGRVSAVNSISIGASNQLGEFESGLTAHWFGPVASVVIGGLGTLAVVGLWMALFPSLTRRDRLAAEECPDNCP